jgi:O-antigen ligase
VNRNHFAGWMLLATSIGVAYFLAHVTSNGRRWPETWRERLLWFDSRDARPFVFTAAAIVTMLCSILWTMSRSGIAGTGVAMTILIVAALRGASGRARRTAAACGLALVLAGIVAWRGADTLVNWYQKTNTLEWRIQLWEDTAPVLVDFWPTGTGFNTYGPAMVLYPRTDMTVRPLEAHSDYLQLAVEGGVLVGVPFILLVIGTARDIYRRFQLPQDDATWWIRMGAVAGICGIAVQELTEFSLQIPGVAVLFMATLAIALHEPAPVEHPVRRRRRSEPEIVTSI